MSSLRNVAFTGVGLLGAVLTLTGCEGDGQQGIPTDPPKTPASTETTTTAPTSTTVAPPPGPAVAELPGNPQAASALSAFLTDLDSGGVPAVTPRCWTLPPSEIPVQYADVAAIGDAAAGVVVDGPDGVTWTGPVLTLSATPSDIRSGYACPRVRPTGTAPAVTDVDANYTVARYLGRFTGVPVSPDDLEGDHPLVCAATVPWDPQGTGAPTAPPLANNPGRLTGSASYDPDSVYVAYTTGDYTVVYADVTNVSGYEQNQVFTLTPSAGNYCIGDVA